MSTSFASVASTGRPHTAFPTGSRRDNRVGKGRYDLLMPYVTKRDAIHSENGGNKYGDRNWEKGQPLMTYYDSGKRHFDEILMGPFNEDHAAAARWNLAGFMWTLNEIECGRLPKELDDRPEWAKEAYNSAMLEKQEPAPEEETTTIGIAGKTWVVPSSLAVALWGRVCGPDPAPKPRKVPGTDVIVPEQFKGKRVFYDPNPGTSWSWSVSDDGGLFKWHHRIHLNRVLGGAETAADVVRYFPDVVEVPL